MLSTKSSLVTHIKRAKYCIEKRSQTRLKSFVCISCNKVYTSKQNLNIHLENCVSYQLEIEQKRIGDIVSSKNELVSQLQSQLKEKDQIIRELQDKLENVALKAVSRSTITTNNTINAIIQRLDPVTTESIEASVPQLTIEHIKRGPEGYAEYALKHPFKNRVVCVDYSRRKIKYKDENGNIISDPEMTKLATRLFQSINNRNRTLIAEYGRQLANQVEDGEKLMDDLAEIGYYQEMVNRGADGEKTDLYHEFIKNFCSNSV